MTNKNKSQSVTNYNESSNTLNAETNTKLSSGCNKKDAGSNAWTSVAQNYNISESCEKHEKNEGNNQWCSTCK